MKARISQLCKTETEWSRLPEFVPLQGEFIIFSPDKHYHCARLKIGDGSTPLKKLPFCIDFAIDDFVANQCDKIIDAGRVSDYKK